MAACLAGLPKLGTLCIGFLDGDPRLDQIRLSPITRAAVPSLTFLNFIGYSNYLEDLVALIDCPRLNCVKIWYHHSHHVNFQVSQVFQFINRSEDPRLLSRWACVVAENRSDFTLALCHEDDSDQRVAISLDSKGWEISHLIQLLSQFSAKLSDVRHLSILWCLIEDLDLTEWLQLFRPFTTVQTLHGFGNRLWKVVVALEVVAKREMAAELFPALLFLCFEPPGRMPLRPQEEPDDVSVPHFDAARRLSGHPITVVEDPWEFYDILSSYYEET
jgi:hypothetical protein